MSDIGPSPQHLRQMIAPASDKREAVRPLPSPKRARRRKDLHSTYKELGEFTNDPDSEDFSDEESREAAKNQSKEEREEWHQDAKEHGLKAALYFNPKESYDPSGVLHCTPEFLGVDPEIMQRTKEFLEKVPEQKWNQAKFMGHMVPRQTLWFTKDGKTSYKFGGKRHQPTSLELPKPLLDLQNELVKKFQNFLDDTTMLHEEFRASNQDDVNVHKMNCVLGNRYVGGKSSVSWHNDNETEFGGPDDSKTIISVSFGETRTFQVKPNSKGEHYKEILQSEDWLRVKGGKPKGPLSLELEDMDIVVMLGRFQREFLHCVPKQSEECGVRYNLTFRRLVKPALRK